METAVITKDTVLAELFRVAEYIARDPKLRGSKDTIHRRMFEVTNKVAMEIQPRPKWFPEVASARNSIIEMLRAQLKGHQLGKRYVYLPDALKVEKGEIPEHLKEWDNEWIDKFIPALLAHKEVYLKGF